MFPFPKHKTQNKNIKYAGGDSGSSVPIPIRETKKMETKSKTETETTDKNKLYRAQERLIGFSPVVHHLEGQRITDKNVYTLSENLFVKHNLSPMKLCNLIEMDGTFTLVQAYQGSAYAPTVYIFKKRVHHAPHIGA